MRMPWQKLKDAQLDLLDAEPEPKAPHRPADFAPRSEVVLPRYVSDVDKNTLTALYSAKNNRPWGQGRKRLVELAHHLANSCKDLVKWFMHGVRRYGRLESMAAGGDPKKWKVKYDSLLKEHREDPTPFVPSRKHLELVEFLFPELLPLPWTADRSVGKHTLIGRSTKNPGPTVGRGRPAQRPIWCGDPGPAHCALTWKQNRSAPIRKHMSSKPARLWF